MQEELNALSTALEKPERPLAAIVGGSKISTKLEVLKNLVAKVDILVLGGGMANVAPIPGGLGALEAAQVAIVGAAAGQPEVGFVVGVIVRLHTTLLLALGLGALTYQGVSLARLRLAVQRASA